MCQHETKTSSYINAPVALPPVFIGYESWVGPNSGLGTVAKTNISLAMNRSQVPGLCQNIHLGSLVGVVTTRGSAFDSWQGQEICFVFTVCRRAMGLTQPSVQWVLGAASPGIKRQEREADHSPVYYTEVKNAWSNTFTPPHAFMA
jgi:hypothetical protein